MLHRPSTGQFRPKKTRIRRTIRSLLTAEQMNFAIQRESMRVDRRPQSSLVLVLFHFSGAPTAPSTMRLVKSILHRVRITDDVGWFDEQHVGVILPDTAPAGAWRLAQQVCDRVARHSNRPHVVMYSYSGSGADSADAQTVLRQTDEPLIPEAKAG